MLHRLLRGHTRVCGGFLFPAYNTSAQYMPSSYFGERFFKSALQPLRYYTDPIARGIEYYGKPVSAALEIGIPAYGVYSRIKKDYSKPRNHPGTALISATADLDAYRLADEYMQQKYEDAQEEKMMRKAK